MQLFSISTTVNNETVNKDYTQHITMPSYKVNEFDETIDWVDGNKRKHKHIVRTRIKGSFTMKFLNVEDFDEFFETLEANKIGSGDHSGAVLCTVYLNKKNITKSAYLFIDTDPANTRPYIGVKKYDGFEVKVEEA